MCIVLKTHPGKSQEYSKCWPSLGLFLPSQAVPLHTVVKTLWHLEDRTAKTRDGVGNKIPLNFLEIIIYFAIQSFCRESSLLDSQDLVTNIDGATATW